MDIENHLQIVYKKMPKQVKDNLILLTYGGSHAYGTNVETSDIDLRGVCLNTKEQLLGLDNFEQWVDIETDTTIYSFNKLVSLLINCNPNVIEILGCNPEHYIVLTSLGKKLLDNAKLFLSQKAIYSFGGYATSQLRRLQNAISRDSNNEQKEQHITNTIKNMKTHLNEHYKSFGVDNLNIYLDDSNREELNKEVFIDINLKHYPLRDFRDIQSEMIAVIKSYETIGKRNNKKTEEKLSKHAMHLIRLHLMLIDILEKQEIKTFRHNDIELLMKIRNGEIEFDEIFKMVDGFESIEEELKNTTSLPVKIDYDKINKFIIDVNLEAVRKG